MAISYTYFDSPIGVLLLAGTSKGLALLGFPGGKMQRRHEPDWIKDATLFTDVIDQLGRYFAGTLVEFTVPLSPVGTDFQLQVWQGLQEIPYGETWSYGQLAVHIRKPKAARAVGAANGVNPIPIIIPCHRVIGGNGKLTGFGGGLETKEFLLKLESRRYTPEFSF